MNEKFYGFLMQRINLDTDLYVFKPISLIDGTLQEYFEDRQCFVTNDENSFYFANDIMSLDLDADMVIYNVISESDLLKEFETDDLTEAKTLYSNDIFEYVYFGVASYDEEEISIGQAPINELLYNIINARDMSESEEVDVNEKVIFDADFFDKLLTIENNEELRSTIQQYAASTKELLGQAYEQIGVEYPNRITNLFNKIYSTLLETNDLKEMKELLNNAEETYIELMYDVDKFDAKNKEIAINLLDALANDYKTMQEMKKI